MAVDVIEKARQKIAVAQRRLDSLNAERDQLNKEVTRWGAFLADAEMLVDADEVEDAGLFSVTPQPDTQDAKLTLKPQLIVGSHAAAAVQLILDRGPLTLDQILEAMLQKGRGVGDTNLRANVGSAIWRRREDVFDRESKDAPYTLRTRNFIYVPPSQKAGAKG